MILGFFSFQQLARRLTTYLLFSSCCSCSCENGIL